MKTKYSKIFKIVTPFFILFLFSITSVFSQGTNESMLNNKHKITFENSHTIENGFLKLTTTITFPKNYFATKAKVTIEPNVTTSERNFMTKPKGVFNGEAMRGEPEKTIKYSEKTTVSFKSYSQLTEGETIKSIDLNFELDINGVHENFTLEERKIQPVNNDGELDTLKVENATKEQLEAIIEKLSNKDNIDTLVYLKIKLAEKYNQENNYEGARLIYLDALEDAKKSNNTTKTGEIYTQLARNSFLLNNNLNAVDEYKSALNNFEESENNNYKKETYTSLAFVYEAMKEYEIAIETLKKAIDNCDPNDVASKAKLNDNLASIYTKIQQYEEALKLYEENIVIEGNNNNEVELVKTLNNAATIYLELKNYEKAEEYLLRAIELDNTNKTYSQLNNLARVYYETNKVEEAITTYKKISEGESSNLSKAKALHNIGKIYYKNQNYTEADIYLKKSNEIAETDNFFSIKKSNNYLLADIIAKTSACDTNFIDFKKYLSNEELKALENESLLMDYKEKYLIADANVKLIATIGRQDTELTKNREKIKLQEAEKQLLEKDKQAEIIKNERQKRWIISLSIGIFLILLLTIFAVLQLILKRKAFNELKTKNAQIIMQNEEISAQAEDLLNKNEKITQMHSDLKKQNTKIKSSITYANTIQTAILPNTDLINKQIKDYFIFYKPKDIVSGDFYWLSNLNKDEYMFACSDCTGHGVPGAMMSMLGIGLLNEIVNENKVTTPGIVLYNLKDMIIKSLNQGAAEYKVRDGMDMVLVKINTKTMKGEFAGANNPLIIVRNKKIITYQPTDMPVGAYYFKKDAPFENIEFDIEKGDAMYMFSDGFQDQIGGPRRKKYFKRNFLKLLLDNNDKTMVQQKEILKSEFVKWRGKLRQIDDISVVGIKF